MPLRSPHPDVDLPDVALDRFVLGAARERGDRPALISGETGAVLTYAALADAVERAAAAFAAHGVRPRDVVGIFAPNVPEYAIAYFGILRAGAAATTINGLYTADDVAMQLRDAHARVLVTAAPLLDRALPAAAAAGIDLVVSIGGGEGAVALDAFLDTDAPPPDVEAAADDIASLPYSSGTTGLPKGVMLTHRNLVANIVQFAAVRPYDEAEVTIAILPFFHSYGQTVVLNYGLHAGATIVTLARFDLQAYLELTERHRATVAYVAPPLVLALAKHPLVDQHDLSSLRAMLSGAAPLDATLTDACAARIGCDVVQGYGMTEASPVTHAVPKGSPGRPGSVGLPLPSTECRIVSVETGEEVGTGERGELQVRGPQVMAGYLGNPDATAATIVDGWLCTGDVAMADEEGWTWIVDRVKELIKVSGFQVAPAELEALLVGHPGIADACVIGVPDEAKGEVPKAFVVLREGTTTDDVAAFVEGRVAPHKRLRAVEAVDVIPRSASGKILRRVLADRERAGAPR